MTAQPLLPKNAPFTPEDIDALNSVVARTTPQQRAWLAGFFAGFEAAQAGGAPPQAAVAAKPRQALTVLYASESGNAEALAMRTKKLAQKHGLDAKVVDFADADLAVLSKAKNLMVFASTWGEGDPPGRAVDFYAALMGPGAPRIEGVRFAVLALGDTAYAQFCATGKAIDERLAALGGTRAFDRVDLDLDYSKQAAEWTEKALGELAPSEGAGNATVVHVDFKGGAPAPDDDNEPQFTAENPLTGEISTLVNLNGSGSTRETWHVEIAAEAPGFSYLPGDAIGIVPENDRKCARVGGGGGPRCRRRRRAEAARALRRDDAVPRAGRKLCQAHAAHRSGAPRRRQGLRRVRRGPPAHRPVRALSREAQPGTAVRPAASAAGPAVLGGFQPEGACRRSASAGRRRALGSYGKKRGGVASTYFADRRRVGDAVRVYVKPNRHFRLPEDGNRPIIMIGAGTGVAPYRAFIEDRAEDGAKGKSWLFFGERNFTNDFLYQLEWQEALADGTLSRIDVAFSRDQPEKIYVQQRLWESAGRPAQVGR